MVKGMPGVRRGTLVLRLFCVFSADPKARCREARLALVAKRRHDAGQIGWMESTMDLPARGMSGVMGSTKCLIEGLSFAVGPRSGHRTPLPLDEQRCLHRGTAGWSWLSALISLACSSDWHQR